MRRDPGDDGPASGPLPGPDDDDVAAIRAAQHDPRAFAPVYARHFAGVYGYCYRRLGEREAAADATSQAFTRALAGVAGFRDGSVGAWLMTIARHVVIDTVRARRPHLDLDATTGVASPGQLPDEQTIAGDEAGRLRAAIARLTPEQRDIVELRWAGLNGPEIAETLGISHRAVRSGQHRAYRRLRDLLDRDHFLGEAP